MTQDLADFLRYERTMLLAAVARIDERLAAMGPPTRDALPRRTPAAIVVVLRAAGHPMRPPGLQDVLGLDGAHRMNTPGVALGCWQWRFDWRQVPPEPAQRMAALTRAHGRNL